MASKRIIILCDGTWQSRTQTLIRGIKNKFIGQFLTNIALLGQAIKTKDAEGVEQIVFYQDGVGTGLSLLTNIVAGATGAGLTANLIEAYSFLVDNYNEGDEIFLFGYSRGAFTARALSGFVLWAGIMTKAQLSYIQPIFDAYKGRSPSNPAKTDYAAKMLHYFTGKWPSEESMKVEVVAELRRFSNGRTRTDDPVDPGRRMRDQVGPRVVPPKIKFIGVMETVGALGIPGQFQSSWAQSKFSFFDTGLSSNVEIAYQALALDENREDFTHEKVGICTDTTLIGTTHSPTLWDHFDPTRGQTMTEVWFNGAHGDVGGGNKKRGLADVVLANLCAHLTDRPENQSPLLALDIEHIKRIQDRSQGWAMAEPERSRHWYTFRKERQVCGTLWEKEHPATTPPSPGSTSAGRGPVWGNDVPFGPNREMIHHSIVEAGRANPATSEQFEVLRKKDPDVLHMLWTRAADPSSLLPTERYLRWTRPDRSSNKGRGDGDDDASPAPWETWPRPPLALRSNGKQRKILLQDAFTDAMRGIGVWIDVVTWPATVALSTVVAGSTRTDNLAGKPPAHPGRVSADYFRRSGRKLKEVWRVGKTKRAESRRAPSAATI
ncbi:hypothetical protein V8E36_003046 [Tilletia maclaganii]